ncbi:HDOD domain-containing protein [Thalassotalea fusca]
MKVLLLDDASGQLASLATELSNRGCKTALFTDAVRAVKAIAQHEIELVICTEKPNKTSGYHVLKAISIRYPHVIRVIVDNNAGSKKSNEFAHAHFGLGHSASDIANQLLNFKHTHSRITKAVVVKAVSQVKTLPSPPKVYVQLKALLDDNNCDSDKIADIITQDPALAAKVLQCSNNSFVQSNKPLTNISDAITKMGVETLSLIVMTAELFSQQADIPGFSIADEQTSALATAKFAASLVELNEKEQTLLVGLLHRLGMLILLGIEPQLTQKYLALPNSSQLLIDVQRKIFGTDHCQVGAYLLHQWSFSYDMVRAVLEYCAPAKLIKQPFGSAHAVYIASNLIRKQQLDEDFVKHFALEKKLPALEKRAAKYL